MKRDVPSPKTSLPDPKRTQLREPLPTRFLLPPKQSRSDSGKDTSNEDASSSPKSRTSSVRFSNMDTSRNNDFDDFKSPTYPPKQISPQRIMVTSSTTTPKKVQDKYAFIKDYEEYSASIQRYPNQAPHWRGTRSPPTWMSQKISASELILQQVFLTKYDVNNTHSNIEEKEISISGAYEKQIITMMLKRDEEDEPDYIAIVMTVIDKDSRENQYNTQIKYGDWNKVCDALQKASNTEIPAIQDTEADSILLTIPIISYQENKNEAETVVITISNKRFDQKLERTLIMEASGVSIDFPWVHTPVIAYHARKLQQEIESNKTEKT